VLIVVAQDTAFEGIPVICYDRLIENPKALYVTFDDHEIGKMQARAIFAVNQGELSPTAASLTDVSLVSSSSARQFRSGERFQLVLTKSFNLRPPGHARVLKLW
jgi:ABC-type xylose transport system substrate-binding protein